MLSTTTRSVKTRDIILATIIILLVISTVIYFIFFRGQTPTDAHTTRDEPDNNSYVNNKAPKLVIMNENGQSDMKKTSKGPVSSIKGPQIVNNKLSNNEILMENSEHNINMNGVCFKGMPNDTKMSSEPIKSHGKTNLLAKLFTQNSTNDQLIETTTHNNCVLPVNNDTNENVSPIGNNAKFSSRAKEDPETNQKTIMRQYESVSEMLFLCFIVSLKNELDIFYETEIRGAVELLKGNERLTEYAEKTDYEKLLLKLRERIDNLTAVDSAKGNPSNMEMSKENSPVTGADLVFFNSKLVNQKFSNDLNNKAITVDDLVNPDFRVIPTSTLLDLEMKLNQLGKTETFMFVKNMETVFEKVLGSVPEQLGENGKLLNDEIIEEIQKQSADLENARTYLEAQVDTNERILNLLKSCVEQQLNVADQAKEDNQVKI